MMGSFIIVMCPGARSGHFKLRDEDFIELEEIEPEDKTACRRIVELSRGTSSFCRICGGCGADNRNFVVTGEQMERKIGRK